MFVNNNNRFSNDICKRVTEAKWIIFHLVLFLVFAVARFIFITSRFSEYSTKVITMRALLQTHNATPLVSVRSSFNNGQIIYIIITIIFISLYLIARWRNEINRQPHPPYYLYFYEFRKHFSYFQNNLIDHLKSKYFYNFNLHIRIVNFSLFKHLMYRIITT